MPELAIDSNLLHYRIVSKIGTGGMGEVYLAEDTRLGRMVALKFLAREFSTDSDHLGRFIREARAASALNHPNICTIYEIQSGGDTPFISMEYIEGETLAEMINRRRRNVRQTIDVAVQVAGALAEAHTNGIVHRDIKPANIIVNSRGQVKVLDFGLAKKISAELRDASGQFMTQAGIIVGTASYMSPEQARGLEIDARTDIWSLGVCLYEMLTGTQPFTGETSTDTLASILTREPIAPRRLHGEIPADLERIVLKTLQKDRNERYPSASDLLADLKPLQFRIEFEAEAGKDFHEPRDTEEQTRGFDSATTEIALARITEEALKNESSRPNNLAKYHSSIIGRETEAKAISDMLADGEIRLVTLTGVGGTGKTRLSQAVARRLLYDFSDGVFFIELASITQPELVASSIGQPLGIKDEGGRPVLEILKEFLKDRRMLLVLDNFEQVVAAAPAIAELLSATNKLKILVTSRFVLNIKAEREFGVPPLVSPSPGVMESLDEMGKNEAVRLFVERARAVKPSFTLTEENARKVAEICARLDGLPLAIELAAARIKILSPSAILEKLQDRLKFLTGGSRDLPARHQTMHDAVEWSYDLLTELEKTMLRRLSVFSGGFRLDAAEFIALSSETQDSPVFELVGSLVDKSFLFRRDELDEEPRFRMLEVVRDYALAKLEESGEAIDARQKHAEYFVSLGEQAEPFVQASQSPEWLNRLEEEHDNLRAVMQWSLENDPPLAVRLAVAVRNFWLLHSHLTEGYGWLKAALESSSGHPPAELRFKLMNGLGLAARFRGDYETARKAYADGLAAGKEAGDKQGIALSSRGLGLVAMQQGDRTAASEYFEAGLSISRELADKFGVAISLSFLGDLARTEGDFQRARPMIEESLELFRELDNKSAMSDSLNNLGAAAFGSGDHESARRYFAEAAHIARDLGNKITISCSLDGFAALAVENADYARAARLSGAADALRESIGYNIEPAEQAFRTAYLDKLRGKMPDENFSIDSKKGSQFTLEEALALTFEADFNKDEGHSIKL